MAELRIFTGLGPGNYNVQMRDASHTGCIRVLNAHLPITQPAMLNAMVQSYNDHLQRRE